MLVKAHNSIGKVECYYRLLRRAYKIIKVELTTDSKRASKELILQIALKVINNTTSLNSLVPILLVFSLYP